MAVEYFLKLDGIPGESTVAKHRGEIVVSGFSWGVSRPEAPAGGGGGAAGKAIFEDLLVVARTSKASPKLFQACASGQHLKSALLTCRQGGAAAVEFLRVALTDVVVTSYDVDGSEEPPTDQFALAFAKVEMEYVPVDKSGKPQAPVKAAWDVAKNVKA